MPPVQNMGILAAAAPIQVVETVVPLLKASLLE